MANRDLVAIGASAGGVEALSFLCKALPAQFPATILITLHLPSHHASTLDRILSHAGSLPATFARDGDTLRRGRNFSRTSGVSLDRRSRQIAVWNRRVPVDDWDVGAGISEAPTSSRDSV